ncbi:hypothetical protein HYPSUDRAFT_544652 [Hypholoma sublateritium FD-334 SS-4]|uniref:Uncharacterized protein n=1 Tax=Hypholoma sublateritium (strain FD-334 SS-4) TaxID=945553 RepID=A0A0D2NZ40_HYPSF|nr:hypothetical protein HYPSUDRAFT_544652 [Hypholoma sublateritium FD-334 SS-4]
MKPNTKLPSALYPPHCSQISSYVAALYLFSLAHSKLISPKRFSNASSCRTGWRSAPPETPAQLGIGWVAKSLLIIRHRWGIPLYNGWCFHWPLLRGGCCQLLNPPPEDTRSKSIFNASSVLHELLHTNDRQDFSRPGYIIFELFVPT